MTKLAADRLYAKTGVQPSAVQVVELHDCFSANELITYEALGLCPEVILFISLLILLLSKHISLK